MREPKQTMPPPAALDFLDLVLIGIVVAVFGGSTAIIHQLRLDYRRLERMLEALLRNHGVTLPPIVSEEVQRVLRNPAKIRQAIKLHQQETGLDRKRATADVKAYMAESD